MRESVVNDPSRRGATWCTDADWLTHSWIGSLERRLFPDGLPLPEALGAGAQPRFDETPAAMDANAVALLRFACDATGNADRQRRYAALGAVIVAARLALNPAKPTRFETALQELRNALPSAASLCEFASRCLRCGAPAAPTSLAVIPEPLTWDEADSLLTATAHLVGIDWSGDLLRAAGVGPHAVDPTLAFIERAIGILTPRAMLGRSVLALTNFTPQPLPSSLEVRERFELRGETDLALGLAESIATREVGAPERDFALLTAALVTLRRPVLVSVQQSEPEIPRGVLTPHSVLGDVLSKFVGGLDSRVVALAKRVFRGQGGLHPDRVVAHALRLADEFAAGATSAARVTDGPPPGLKVTEQTAPSARFAHAAVAGAAECASHAATSTAAAATVVRHAGSVDVMESAQHRGDFFPDESIWEFSFDGESNRLPHRAGFSTIRALLRRPDHKFDLFELPGAGVRPTAKPDTACTPEDLRAYRGQIDQLMLKSAAGTLGASEESELAKLTDFVSKNSDRSGRPRRMGAGYHREQHTATRRVADALRCIAKRCPKLAGHLEAAISIRAAGAAYRPKAIVAWRLDARRASAGLPGITGR